MPARGKRLAGDHMPPEILPVVGGMNEALHRIDAGFEVTERFFMNAAHELRTPIAVLQLRLDAFPPGPDRDKARNTLRRLTSISDQLLDIERFRQGPMDMKAVDLCSLVAAVLADLAPYAISEGYTLAFEQPDMPMRAHGDAPALERMVGNLVQNAVQHGGNSGTITARVTPVGIEVADQGAGIPPDRQDRIFDPFFRVNPQGSGAGLGLKMVRDIARGHGGEVTLSSSSPKGSTFTVKLPVM